MHSENLRQRNSQAECQAHPEHGIYDFPLLVTECLIAKDFAIS